MSKTYFSPLTTKLSVLLLPALLLVSCGYDGNGGPYDPQNKFGEGPAPVSLSKDGAEFLAGDLGSSESYVIMAKTGVSNVTGSMITGNIGVSPAATSYITGFSLVADASNEFSTSSSVVGNVYGATDLGSTPSNLTTAIGNMETAYTDAAGRSNPDFTELHAGDLGSKTLTPGLYKWGTGVTIPLDVTISGSSTDVWIFQIAQNVTMAAGVRVTLIGGAQAKNIFWQVAGQVDIGTGAHFEGIILSQTAVVFGTNATMNGRVYAQSAVTLDDNIITEP